MTLEKLIASLTAQDVLRSPHIRQALQRVDRKKFIPKEQRIFAYDDIPLPIGEGQTISQPYTVVFMLELLKPKRGEHIVDIGAGSCWQTCLLADIVRPKGKIYAIEIISSLCEFGQKNIAQFPELKKHIEYYCQDASRGLPEVANKIGGFDAIIAAAEVREVPDMWRQQLKIGGRMVYPKSASLFCEEKKKDGTFRSDSYAGFAFVPFVGRETI